jgi:hypothetical protein
MRADVFEVLSRIVGALVCAIVLLAVPQSASAGALLPPQGKVFTGVAMGDELEDFTRRTGQQPQIWQQFVAWNHPFRWAVDLARGASTRLMLGISTAPGGQNSPGVISPAAIAAGRGDRWLSELRDELSGFGNPVYIRLMGEMNNCDNAYAPVSCSGASRGASHSTTAFVKAWRRTATILRGRNASGINAKLAQLHLPPLQAAAPPRRPAPIAMVWTPMTAGSPMIAALDPARFWPGDRWVDWVGTSFYSKYPRFDWLSRYYQRFSSKPFAIAEWAMWDNGDPGFVRQVMQWVASHPRTRMHVYNQGKDPNGPFRLKHFPSAAQALRSGLGSRRFSVL